MTVFHVFSGDDYYPEGGARDHLGSFPTLGQARESIKSLGPFRSPYLTAWAHITDSHFEIVEFYEYGRPDPEWVEVDEPDDFRPWYEAQIPR